MDRIISTKKAIQISKTLHEEGKRVVLAGGCFDILHIGHIIFLNNAKAEGDVLMILLEHDDAIKKTKGDSRPFNNQHDRSIILGSLEMVDYIICLPPVADNAFYDELVNQLKPAIIATTKGDTNRFHKERQAKLIGAEVVDVTDIIENQSTSKIVTILKEL